MRFVILSLVLFTLSSSIWAEPAQSKNILFGTVQDADGGKFAIRWDPDRARYNLIWSDGIWDSEKRKALPAEPVGFLLDRRGLEAFAADYRRAKHVVMAMRPPTVTDVVRRESSESGKPRELVIMATYPEKDAIRAVAIDITPDNNPLKSQQIVLAIQVPASYPRRAAHIAAKASFEAMLEAALKHQP